jgi:hypothetical protein
MYALSHEHVCHPDNDAEPWIPSRCLTMDARSDSDILAFRRQVTISTKRYRLSQFPWYGCHLTRFSASMRVSIVDLFGNEQSGKLARNASTLPVCIRHMLKI